MALYADFNLGIARNTWLKETIESKYPSLVDYLVIQQYNLSGRVRIPEDVVLSCNAIQLDMISLLAESEAVKELDASMCIRYNVENNSYDVRFVRGQLING